MIIPYHDAHIFILSKISVGVINIVKTRGIAVVKALGVPVAIAYGLQLVAVIGIINRTSVLSEIFYSVL